LVSHTKSCTEGENEEFLVQSGRQRLRKKKKKIGVLDGGQLSNVALRTVSAKQFCGSLQPRRQPWPLQSQNTPSK